MLACLPQGRLNIVAVQARGLASMPRNAFLVVIQRSGPIVSILSEGVRHKRAAEQEESDDGSHENAQEAKQVPRLANSTRHRPG